MTEIPENELEEVYRENGHTDVCCGKYILSADDHRTFIELYDTYFSRVYSYVHYRVNDFHDADDLTSQASPLSSIINNISRRKRRFSLIFTIARNTLTDYYRSRVRCTYVSPRKRRSLLITDLTSTTCPQRICTGICTVLSCFGRGAEIIALKFWSGCTNRDIAKFMGISESNTGVILFQPCAAMSHPRKPG